MFFLITACGNKTPEKTESTTSEEYDYIKPRYNREEQVSFSDSTWYFTLGKAWEKRDTVAVRPFFEAWHNHTLKMDYTPKTSYKSTIDTIIKTLYDYYPPHREFAVFPDKIYYSVIDTSYLSFQDESRRASENFLDTMFFCPDENIIGCKVIMHTDPFRRYLDAFIYRDNRGAESWDKLRFIRYYLVGGFQTYQEDPMIYVIILHKDLNTAYVEYIYNESGMEAWLIRNDKKWEILRRETRWSS